MELEGKSKEQGKVYDDTQTCLSSGRLNHFPLTTLLVTIITINHQIEIDLLIGDNQ